jgi:glycosyltransferase involved in cell wall biosynthesis
VTKHRLIVIGPLPPPRHGVTVSTSLVLANPVLCDCFELDHVDTSDHRTGGNIGNWDITNMRLAVLAVLRLAGKLRGRPGVVYLPLSQSTPGVLRDSMFVFVAWVRGWKVAAHLRGSEFRDYYRSAHPIMRRWIRATLARVDSVAVMGESLRGVFHGLVSTERITVVANGTPEFEPKFSIQRDPEHVLFLSSLRRRKGVIEAVQAALLVLAARPSTRFTFAGGWESRELELALQRCAGRANGRIEFRGPVSAAEKDQLLESAAVLLFPPVEPEGHPRVVIEAMAAGLAVVTTNRGAISETVGNEEAGFVLSDPEPEELAERTLRLLRDHALRERMSKAARARYLEYFTQEQADRRLADWLELLAAAPGGGDS